jgi:hypothetical protein
MFSFFEKMNKSNRIAQVFFLVVSIFLTCEYIIAGKFSYVRVGDNLDTFVPRLSTLWNLISDIHPTYWYPYLAGGVDRLANDISFLRIDALFSGIFSDWATYAVILVVSIFLGGYYTFLIAKRVLKYRIEASLIAGLFYMFALLFEDIIPFMLGFGIFPFVIYQFEIWRIRMKEIRTMKTVLIIVGTSLVFGLFSSLAFTLPFTIVGLIVWFLFFRQERRLIFWMGLFLGIFIAISFHLQEANSLFLHASLSNRSGGYFNGGIAGYISYFRYIFGLYGLSLVILVVGAISFKIKDRFMLSIIGLVCASIFLIPAYQMIATAFPSWLGLFADFDMRRFFLLFPFLFAIGFAHLINESSGTLTIAPRDKTYALPKIFLVLGLVLLFCFHIATKASHTYGWLKLGGFYEHTYSQDLDVLANDTVNDPPFRVGTVVNGNAVLVPTLPHFFEIETVDGHANLTSQRYIDFFRLVAKDQSIKSSMYLFHQASDEDKVLFSEDSSEFVNVTLLSLANVRFLVSTLPISADNFVLISETKEIAPEDENSNFFERQRSRIDSSINGRDLLIYENEEVFPRLFVTGRVQIEKDSADILSLLENASMSDLRSNAVLNLLDINENVEKYSVFDDVSGVGGSVNITRYDSDEVLVKVSIDAPSFLVLINAYDPFWKAYIDDQYIDIVPAYHAFMGIPLFESGEYEVLFRYEPPYSIFSN